LGLALSHQVQERLPEAREALLAAEQALADATLPDAERDAAEARILAALGNVAAKQGRVDEALELADRVAKLRPDHPYPHLLRGRALARVWRWEQAVPHLELAFAASPGSPTLAGELATALGSAGMHRRALEIAATALVRRPRDATLLRVQALALRALGNSRADAALEAYYKHREPDDQPHLSSDCGERDPNCARERVPVHMHE
jgi:tetratricopeptide (TPR) repeat protein